MYNTRVDVNLNPREKANIFSILTWTWTIEILKKGYSKILKVEDLYDSLRTDKSNILGDRLEKQWFVELERAKRTKGHPSFLWAICRTFAREYFVLGLLHVFNEFAIRLTTPLLLGAFLQYFKPIPKATYEEALYYAGGIIFMYFINVISLSQGMFGAVHLGGRIRIAVCSVVYRKSLRLSKASLDETAPGKIVNLIASDVNRFEYVSVYVHHLWSAPLSLIAIMAFLYSEVGWPAVVGMFVIVSVMSFQSYLGNLSAKFRLQTALKTDKRVRLMDEIISGVRVIKMYAWEKHFCKLVQFARRLELKMIRKTSYIRGIYMSFIMFTARAALFGMLITMMFRGQELSAEKVYVYVLCFNMMSISMTSYFALGIAEYAECKVAVGRLQNFLMYEEFGNVNDDSRERSKDSIILRASDLVATEQENSNNESWAVKLNHITAKWDPNATDTTLDDITLEVARGQLYIVIGAVGAGKSSLISAILGELKIVQGNAKVKGSISYADQDVWVFGASVRQNIIFGGEFDRQRYREVVRVCALESDFRQFANGDLTVIGERGSSLSGGQKSRINLARAVYREANVYLLDDPLSAVDAHVSKHLFENCIRKHLAGKTRILATHQLQYVKTADAIVLLDQGRAHMFADYNELLRIHPEYQSSILGEETDVNELSSPKTENQLNDSPTKTDRHTDHNEEKVMKKERFFEDTSRGTVKGNLLVNYIKSGTSFTVGLLVLFLFVATQLCISSYEYFIPILLNAEESRYHYERMHEIENTNFLNDTYENSMYLNEKGIIPRNTCMYIYTGILFSILFLAIVRSLAFYTICVRCSQRLHDFAFGALIRATTRFFDANPSGRILNRFSKDLGAIDELLPRAILDFGQLHLNILGSLVVVCTVNCLFLVPISVVGVLSFVAQKIYLKTSLDLKRLEGMTRSPVFTHLNATLNGITTIRAHKSEEILKKQFDGLQDTHTSSWYIYVAATTTFVFYMDFLCFVLIALATSAFLFMKDNFSSGAVGLTITLLTTISLILQWGLRQNAEMRNQLMSVERVLEYAHLPSEPNSRDTGMLVKRTKKNAKKSGQEELKLVEPPMNWPAEGRIEFKNVFVHYSDDEAPVLRGLTLTIQPSEKVGIVGRTGAGKSSLISALFRLVEVDGIIEIDGIDTGNMVLEDLRKRISIIPQDPVLFSGTLRRNLDPFDEFTDELLWKVLEEVEMKDPVKLTDNGLDHRVQDRGSNYSTGQRQLICLARAILRNNRILMLDEATERGSAHRCSDSAYYSH